MNPYEPPQPNDEPQSSGRSFGDQLENLLRGVAIMLAFIAMAAVCMVIFVGAPIAMLAAFAILFGLLVVGMFRKGTFPDRRQSARRNRLGGDPGSAADRPRGRRFPKQ